MATPLSGGRRAAPSVVRVYSERLTLPRPPRPLLSPSAAVRLAADPHRLARAAATAAATEIAPGSGASPAPEPGAPPRPTAPSTAASADAAARRGERSPRGGRHRAPRQPLWRRLLGALRRSASRR